MVIINFENIATIIKTDYDKIKGIDAYKIIIEDLSIINKFNNLEYISIIDCTMKYNDLVNFDYSKFINLTELTLYCNSTNKIFFNDTELAHKINIDAKLENIDYAKSIIENYNYYFVNNGITYIKKYVSHIGLYKQYENEFNRSTIKNFVSYQEYLKKIFLFETIIFNYEKNNFIINNEIESKIPINKSIYNLSLKKLILSYYHLEDFFELLPIGSLILNSLEKLYFNLNDNYLIYKFYTKKFLEYIYPIIQNYKIKTELINNNMIFNNVSISKFLLFVKLKNTFIFNYICSDMYNLFEVDKNRIKIKIDTKFYNLILYYNTDCYYWSFNNSIINFTPNIKKLYVWFYTGDCGCQYDCDLLFTNNLPNELEYLKIKFIQKYLDNYHRDYFEFNGKIISNLPFSLKKLTLTNIGTKMSNNIPILPFGCLTKYKIFDLTKYY